MRNFILFTVIFLVLAGLGTFAWVSNNPESPHLERAQGWPLVGPVATMIREAYLGPRTARGDGDETELAQAGFGSEAAGEGRDDEETIEILDLSGSEPRVIRTREELEAREARVAELQEAAAKRPPIVPERLADEPTKTQRQPAGTGLAGGRAPLLTTRLSAQDTLPLLALEWTWFLPGQTLHALADEGSETLERLPGLSYLPVLKREGSWRKVRFDEADAWIDTEWQPPHPQKGARRGYLRQKESPVGRTDWESLRAGKKILGVDEPWGEIAGYDVYTDVEDEDLMRLLSSAAAMAEDAFFARYGRLPSRAPKYALLLFSSYEDYRNYSDETANVPTTGHRGHAGVGLIALTVDGSTPNDAAGTLIHEITHILVDRALARRLPRWMDEGIASDLGSVWIERSGGVVPDNGVVAQTNAFYFNSFDSRVMQLDRMARAGQLSPLPVVLSRDTQAFYQSGTTTENYLQSAAFVRYLVDGEDGELAPAFLEFLDAIAKGRRAELLELLGRDARQLDTGFRQWIAEEAAQAQTGMKRRLEARLALAAGGR